jgi:NAD(P)-dependent dehydrogenase (short-subunit alcohol dehydrogenase family)
MTVDGTKRMQGKRVLVSGAGTGIGRGIALEFAKEGAAVALHYSQDDEDAAGAVDQIVRTGGRARAFRADFNRLEEIRRLGLEAVEFLGGLDVLVNNAGITVTLPIEEVTPELYDTVYNINIRGMFFLTQTVLSALTRQGGAVINLASVHAYTGLVDHSVYAGTKGAIVAFTRELGLELIPKKVRVNAIAPGWILVEKHIKAMPPGFDVDAAARLIPAGFIGTPADAGRLAIFLASDESRYIVGQTIVLDGGQSSIQPLADRITEMYHGKLPSKV